MRVGGVCFWGLFARTAGEEATGLLRLTLAGGTLGATRGVALRPEGGVRVTAEGGTLAGPLTLDRVTGGEGGTLPPAEDNAHDLLT